MFKILNQKFGQSSMAQYTVVFFLAIGSIVTMTTFVQRVLQARIRDTKIYMLDNVKTYGNVAGPMYYEYEPYYINVATTAARERNEQVNLLAGGATGIFRKQTNAFSASITNSYQAPPRNAI